MGSAATSLKLAGGAVLLAAFVAAERRHPRPMIDLSLLRDPAVCGTAVAMLGYAAAAQVMMTLLPIYLQDAFDYSPAVAGVAMIPFALPLLFAPGLGGRLAARHASPVLLTFGLSLVALGNALSAAVVWAGAGYWMVAVGMLVTGSGAGILNGKTVKAQLSTVPPERAGMASGIAGTTRFAGIILALAGLGAVLAVVTEDSLHRHGAVLLSNDAVDWHGLALRVVGGDGHGALSALPLPVRDALAGVVPAAVGAGFGAVLAGAAVLALIAAISSWLLVRTKEKNVVR